MLAVVPGEPGSDAGEPAPPPWRRVQRDGDGVHGEQQEHVHAHHHQAGWALLLLLLLPQLPSVLPHWFFTVCVCVCVSEPAPPRSLHAVNATPSSVTLLWVEEGVVDYYQVLCKASGGRKELKVTTVRQSWVGAPQRPWWPAAASHVLLAVSLFSVSSRCLFQAGEPQMVSSQMVTVTGLMPSSTYNCTITSFSYSSTSKPAHISITTTGRWRCTPTPGSAAWSPTTFFMCTQQKK